MTNHHSHKSCPSNLNDVNVGSCVRIKELRGDPTVCQRLREMGFCEYAQVYKVVQSESMICRVCGSNIALSKNVAKNILVEEINPNS